MKKKKALKEFDFTSANYRPIALKFAYMGWPYHGLAAQENDPVETVELHLFAALKKTKLIMDMKLCDFTRCGRTDKGVSSTDQVVSLWVRSQRQPSKVDNIIPYNDFIKLLENPNESSDSLSETPNEKNDLSKTINEKDDDASEKENKVTESIAKETEIEYVLKLNQVLPAYIRVLAWSPVERHFHARFSCTMRTYQYYFHSLGIDMARMKAACNKLVGTFDFRMFCKVDSNNTTRTTKRTISFANVEVLPDGPVAFGARFACCTIKGRSFLWHQVRCLMSVLFHVAQGLEELELIDDLLAGSASNLGRPSYPIASELPLVLMQCDFANVDFDWRYSNEYTATRSMQPIYNLFLQHATKALLLSHLLTQSHSHSPISQPADFIYGVSGYGSTHGSTSSKHYQPILKRPRCRTLEEKQQVARKKAKM